jgi:hypothetical protein
MFRRLAVWPHLSARPYFCGRRVLQVLLVLLVLPPLLLLLLVVVMLLLRDRTGRRERASDAA